MRKSSRHQDWVPKGRAGEAHLPREAPGKPRAARRRSEAGRAGSDRRTRRASASPPPPPSRDPRDPDWAAPSFGEGSGEFLPPPRRVAPLLLRAARAPQPAAPLT